MLDFADLSPAELHRYARQIGPAVLTREGQQRLKGSTVLVTRAGGMGGPAALALAMAGVGRLVIAHGGELSEPDLNRQVLGAEAGLGQSRAEQFAQRLREMNRFVTVEALDHEPNEAQARRLAAQLDLIVSCPPNFAERMRLNAAAVEHRIPLVDAAQWGMTGTLLAVDPGRTACLRCLYPEPPEFEELFPVLGAISAAIGALAALEAIKILAGNGRPLWGQMWVIDGYQARFSTLALQRHPHCPICSALQPQPSPIEDCPPATRF